MFLVKKIDVGQNFSPSPSRLDYFSGMTNKAVTRLFGNFSYSFFIVFFWSANFSSHAVGIDLTFYLL